MSETIVRDAGLNLADAAAMAVFKKLPMVEKKKLLLKVAERLKSELPMIEKGLGGLYKMELSVSEDLIISITLRPTI